MKRILLGLSVITLGALGAFGALASTPCDAQDRGNELCEPARLTGKLAAAPHRQATPDTQSASDTQSEPDTRAMPRMAQGPGMMRERMGHGPGGGMMGRGMGRMREGMGEGHMGQGRMMGNPVRHRHVMMGPGIPAEYANLRNPLPATAENIAAGKTLYQDNCASCHGPKGQGDGEAGKELNPRPANIAFIMDKPIATDGFLMWTISEGGEKLKTDMPAFRDVLSEKQRWQLILYLRNGLR